MEEEGQNAYRMTTRGITRHYVDSPVSGHVDSTPSSISLSHISSEDEQQHSEFHLESSADSLFRTPSLSTRGRKRRSYEEGVAVPIESPTTSRRGRPRGSTRPRGVGRRASGTYSQEDADESSLFSMVKSGKNLHVMSTVIDNWIEEYERHPDNALVQLQQFFISCCGCKGIISSVMLQTMEYSEIIRQMTDQFDEDTGDYPLVMPGPLWKRFKQTLADFVLLLVNKCKSSYVFDQRLMDGVIQLLTGLADSQVRAFRHTSTFIAMKLSSALVDVALELVDLKAKNIRQVETEKAKLKAEGPNSRLDVLINKKAEIDDKTEDTRQMLTYIFKSVFVHRYRDVVPDIRSICINELGQWMSVYPDHFLEDSYLKYIGWSLYDKVSDVRLKCILALLPLYSQPHMAQKLELFTNKFKDRLVTMVMDKDSDVAVRACQLLTEIYRIYPAALTLKDCVPIYEMVYCNHRGLAQAAGEFLNTKVFQNLQVLAPEKNRANDSAKQLIIDLVQFFVEGDCHDHAAYLVDALIDTNPMIKDWKTMADLLLSGEAEGFESELIEVLVCSVKQAASGESPIGRAHMSRKGSVVNKDVRLLQEDRARLSEVLIPQLPQLLQRVSVHNVYNESLIDIFVGVLLLIYCDSWLYLNLQQHFIADRDKVANLITVPLHFQLDMYMASRLEKHLDELMSILESIVEKHADDEILQCVAEIMSYFTTNVAVAQHTETHHLKMLDGLALQLRHSIQHFHREQTVDEEDDAAMLAAFHLKKWQLWDVSLSVLTNADDKQVSRDVGEKAVILLFATLSWDINRLVTEQEPNKAEAIKKLRKHRDQFTALVTSIMMSGASGVENAFLCFVDALMMFNGLPDKSLSIELNRDITRALSMFVEDNVFVEENDAERSLDQQTQVELMHKRRKILVQFCKLILHGVLPIYEACIVLQFYTKFYTDFGDILKTLLTKCRDMDRLSCARAVATALCHHYEEIKRASEGNCIDPNSDDFASIRDLAKRFSSLFGSDPVKSREALAIIHKDGIVFALKNDESINRDMQHTNLSFLEILCEFSSRLLRQDKISVLRYLEKHGEIFAKEEPYIIYKASLQERSDDVLTVRNLALRGRSRGRGRGKGTPTYTPAASVYGGDD
uniref:SCD domain-containing protein n=1 Tax=Wuchereria bancrofti TaxID=6293 RepID=A0A1I8ED25_WUCBA